jgi:dTDP-4-amino-4,6-dideoxygalactose transaminase
MINDLMIFIKYGIRMLEDAAEALGLNTKDRNAAPSVSLPASPLMATR